MKKMNLVLLIAVTVLFSCKKKKEPLPAVQKTYLKSFSVGSANTQYNYDSQNRLANMVYTEPTLTQTIIVDAYDANNNISDYTIRTSGSTTVPKYKAFYDTQSRLTRLERRDSATNNLTGTTIYTIAGNLMTKENRNGIGLLLSSVKYTYDANNNLQLEELFNGAGTPISTYTYAGYDNKISPETLKAPILTGGLFYNNNNIAYTRTIHATGVSTNYTVTNVYNTDNYATQITYSSSAGQVTYNYTYEKR